MLRATDLTMRFAGGVTALDAVTFEARAGQVLGFLGPNGAGKTTAMRICTGFLAPTSGRVTVAGIDVADDPLAARARLGYLPESVPLYPEMRVDEYLAYRAALKGVPAKLRRARIDEAITSVAIAPERRRVIGQLSKGYRQRVGLADALLHAPDVIILDEPTDGLDPNQRRDILDLIARLGQDRAVILSTHILPEVEAVCTRVVILDRGRVIAEGAPAELVDADRDLAVVARGDREALLAAMRAVPGVLAVARDADRDRIRGDGDADRDRIRGDGDADRDRIRGDGDADRDRIHADRDRDADRDRIRADRDADRGRIPADRDGDADRIRADRDGDADRDVDRVAGRGRDGDTDRGRIRAGRDGDADRYRIRADRDVREPLARAILAVGELRELRAAAAGLERVFATLTGRA